MDRLPIGKCGICCGACPGFLRYECAGCMDAHAPGDCPGRDCVLARGLEFCGQCRDFPCEMLLTRPRCTALSRAWLLWQRENR